MILVELGGVRFAPDVTREDLSLLLNKLVGA